MIYSPKVFSEKTRVAYGSSYEPIINDRDYLYIKAIKYIHCFMSIGNHAYPLIYLPEKVKDIVKRQIFEEHRNLRDNFVKLRRGVGNILKIAYYQKNKAITDTAVRISIHCIGAIPEEAITHQIIIRCLSTMIYTAVYIPKRMLTKEIASKIPFKGEYKITYKGEDIKLSDLFEGSFDK